MNYKAGTIVRSTDGREGTVVSSDLTGQGIAWGRHILPAPNENVRSGIAAIRDVAELEFNWPRAEAMLRAPEMAERLGMECIGEHPEVVAVPDRNPLTADSGYRLVEVKA